MTLSFFDKPIKNDYFTLMYRAELCKYCKRIGVQTNDIDDLMTVQNAIVLTLGENLTPEVIVRIKENNNFLVVFDINDNSVLTHTYGAFDEVLLIDLIFKIAGIQTTQESYEMHIDHELNYTRRKKRFQEGAWGKYFDMVAANKVRSLPYPPWDLTTVDIAPWEERNKLALIRGGHHYQRVHLFLHLLSLGMLDESSLFPAREYAFQFCEDCKNIFKKSDFQDGKVTFERLKKYPNISCRLKNWKYDFNVNCGLWNNSCVSRYYDLAELFRNKYGGFELSAVERAFSGAFTNNSWRNKILNRYLLFADFKWIFSIYAPPRFWEGAEACTVNLVPERTNDQEFFPEIQEDVHYITYKEDFSNLEEACGVDQEKFEFITNNCFELYNTWIARQDDYRVSPNLLQHILDEIEQAHGSL